MRRTQQRLLLLVLVVAAGMAGLAQGTDDGTTAGVCPAGLSRGIWELATGDYSVSMSPALSSDDKTVFVGNDKALYAIDVADGSKKWNCTAGQELSSSPAPSNDGKTVFVGSSANKLFAIDVANGTKKWEFETGGKVYSSPALSSDDKIVFVGTMATEIYAVHAANGTEKWELPRKTESSVYASLTLSWDENTILAAGGNLHAVNVADGTQQWSWKPPNGGAMFSSPAFSSDDSTIFVGNNNEKLYAIHAIDGTTKWEFETGGEVWSSPALSSDDKIVFVGSRDKKLYAINAADGTKKWEFVTGGEVWSSPALSSDDKTVFVGSYDKKLYAINATDGALKWQVLTRGLVRSSPALSSDDKTVFVGSTDPNAGTLYAISTASGCAICSSGRYLPRPTAADPTPISMCATCGAGRGPVYNDSQQPAVSAMGCADCSAGTYAVISRSGGYNCAICSAGKYADQTGTATGCKSCAEGHYQDQTGQPSCAQCPGNSWQNETGELVCMYAICPTGKYLQKNTGCFNCGAGTYQDQTGQRSCAKCAPGKASAAVSQTSVSTCIDCDPGKTTNVSGSSMCLNCTSGRYKPDKASSACIGCAAGKFSPGVGQTSAATCTWCAPGKGTKGAIGQGSTNSCTNCSGTQYSNRSDCTMCPFNYYNGQEGRSECKKCHLLGTNMDVSGSQCVCVEPCQTGTFKNLNTGSCIPCVQGRYNPAPGATCAACPAGRWGVKSGADSFDACVACSPGFFGEKKGLNSSTCTGPCSPGKYSIAGLTECLDCAKGRYAAKRGSVNCTECPRGMATQTSGATACVCGSERYLNATGSCALCLKDEMDCGGASVVGLTVSDIKVKPGFWRPNNATSNIKRCPVAKACVNSTCAIGHEGPFCMVCAVNYTRWQRSQLCEPCPSDMAGRITRSIMLLLLCLFLLYLFIRLNRRTPNGVIKPFINASQMVQVLLMFDVNWPESFQYLSSVLGGVNLDAVSLASPSCLGVGFDYHRRLTAMVCVTVALLVTPWLVVLIRSWWRRYRRRSVDAAEARAAWKRDVGHHLRDTCLIILLVHPTLSGFAFNFFNCKFVEEAGGSAMLNKRNGTYYMVADYSLKCYDDQYYGMMVLAVAVIVLFSIGIPVFFALVLWRKRKQLEDDETKRLLGMLYSSYKPKAYWFESVQMLFKLALWASLSFVQDPQIKLGLAQFICFLQVALHSRLEPFSTPFKNAVQSFALLLAFAVSFGGLMINYLESERLNAELLSNTELFEDLSYKLEGFKTFLAVVTYISIAGYGLFAIWRAIEVAAKHQDKVRNKCGKFWSKMPGCGRCCGRFFGSHHAKTEGGGAAETAPETKEAAGASRANRDGTGGKKNKRAIRGTSRRSWTTNPVISDGQQLDDDDDGGSSGSDDHHHRYGSTGRPVITMMIDADNRRGGSTDPSDSQGLEMLPRESKTNTDIGGGGAAR